MKNFWPTLVFDIDGVIADFCSELFSTLIKMKSFNSKPWCSEIDLKELTHENICHYNFNDLSFAKVDKEEFDSRMNDIFEFMKYSYYSLGFLSTEEDLNLNNTPPWKRIKLYDGVLQNINNWKQLGITIRFLTHRRNYEELTIDWAFNVGLIQNANEIVNVAEPKHKIQVLKGYTGSEKCPNEVIFFDDKFETIKDCINIPRLHPHLVLQPWIREHIKTMHKKVPNLLCAYPFWNGSENSIPGIVAWEIQRYHEKNFL